MRPRSAIERRGAPLGFRLWFGFVLAVIFSIWIGAGVLAYRVVQDPDAVAFSAGRLFGVFARSASEGGSR